MTKINCKNDCLKKLAPLLTLFDDFVSSISTREVENLIAILRSIEKAHPMLLESTTELRSIAAEFLLICQDEGERRRKMRLQVLRELRSLCAEVANHHNSSVS